MKKVNSWLALSLMAAASTPACAQLFGPGDPILAVDPDTGVESDYPDGEAPVFALDQDSFTKYLNFGQEGTGLIVTPAYGASIIRSFNMTTANDAPERDPATWEIYGTNDPITSADNSGGDEESWTLIASGDADLPEDRFLWGPFYDFANGTAYTSYKIVFPTVRDLSANSMQIGDLSLFTGTGGGGDQILDDVDAVIAVGTFGSLSRYPGAEGPTNALDGDNFNKYLNFGRENSGFIVSRADETAVVVGQLTMVTANDFSERDPTTWELYGTNDAIVSEDNSTGEAENWTLVDSGSIDLPEDRNTASPTVPVNNSTAYTSYKLLIPSIKVSGGFPGDAVQYSEVIFEEGSNDCYADCNGDTFVDTRDFLCFLNKWTEATGSGIYDPEADCNDDNTNNTQDVICFLNLWTGGC